jgi:hypothetical protein
MVVGLFFIVCLIILGLWHLRSLEELVGLLGRKTILLLLGTVMLLGVTSVGFHWAVTPLEANVHHNADGERIIDPDATRKLVAGPNREPNMVTSAPSPTPSWIEKHVAHLQHALSAPGTVFVTLLGFLTVCGFFITIRQLQRILSRIVGYDVLLNHVYDLIKGEYEWVEEDKNRTGNIQIMANAPTFGNLSDRDDYKKLRDMLDKAFQHPRIKVEVLCLDWTCRDAYADVYYWVFPTDASPDEAHVFPSPPATAIHEPFDQIGTPLGNFYKKLAARLGKEAVQASAYREAIGVLQWVHNRNAKVARNTYIARTTKEQDRLVPLHFIVTSRRGIIFNTIDLPKPDGNGTTVQSADDAIRVLAFGSWESEEVKMLKDSFRYYTRPDVAIRVKPDGSVC